MPGPETPGAETPDLRPLGEHFAQREANFVPLSPLSFLARSARVFPAKLAVTDGLRSFTYAAFLERCRRLPGLVADAGLGAGEAVAFLAPNSPALLEAHYGVPAAGAALCAINTLLDAPTIAYILEHAAIRLFFADREYRARAAAAVALCRHPVRLVEIDDPLAPEAEGAGPAERYEALLGAAAPLPWRGPAEEWSPIALNYTSGTTGRPKGVVYHHRGAYLAALGDALALGLGPDSVHLWTLPMFHCSGWGFTWAVTAVGGTHVCLRKVEPEAVFARIAAHDVSHMCGAPIVLSMLINAEPSLRRRPARRLRVMTGGSAPPMPVVEAMEAMGFSVTHAYGMTECYGPSVVCEAQAEWAGLPLAARVALGARQGVNTVTTEALEVLDEAGHPLPWDGQSLGEIAVRGNGVMMGYLDNPEATAEALRGGFLHTGDLGVMHPDGYVEVRDRAKDIIISGGENISSLEVEQVLYRHPAVREAAVVAQPDARWGESPCAFVALRAGMAAEEAELIEFCRARLAHFKAPRRVIFADLPKTSTGKVQKTRLREIARGG